MGEEVKSFFDFVLQGHWIPGPVGDLAMDIMCDSEFPDDVKATEKELRDYLESKGSCDGALAAFDLCYKEYQKAEWLHK